ncbi:hypothetical protein EON63_09510, partial [archaeon]
MLDAIAYATLFQALSLDKESGLAGLGVYGSLPSQLKTEECVYTSVIQYILPVIRRAQPEVAEEELMKILKDTKEISSVLVMACVYYGLKTPPTPTSTLIEKIYLTYKEDQKKREGS